MDRQIHRYNAKGLAGLADKPRSGRPPAPDLAPLEQFDALVEEGPDICVHKAARRRCINLKEATTNRFGVEVSERHVGRLLTKARRFRRLSVRPRHQRSPLYIPAASRPIMIMPT